MSHAFTGIFEHIPLLEELRLEYCNFFESNDVMPFSKLQNLKTLSLRGCRKMRNCVPYLSLACRFGFPKLEVLDLRETNVSDGELQCLSAIKTLRQLFLEFPEVPLANDESDDDDDFEQFFRRSRRAPAPPEVIVVPENSSSQATASSSNGAPTSPNEGQVSTSSSSTAAVQPEPSTSAQAEPFRSIDDPPSSPEYFSDSEPSSPTRPDDGTLRTIVIRANLNSGPNAVDGNEPRIQVILEGDIPHAR